MAAHRGLGRRLDEAHVAGILLELRCQIASRHGLERLPVLFVEGYIHSTIVDLKLVRDVVPGTLVRIRI
jgi:hypothetical protein